MRRAKWNRRMEMEEGGEELCDGNRFIENRLDGTVDHFRTMLLGLLMSQVGVFS